MKKKRLGEVLVERGRLRQDDLDRALAMQQAQSGRLGEILRTLHVSKADVGSAIEQVQGVAYVECPPHVVIPEVLAILPRALAVKCCALPIEVRNGSLVVAMAEPQDLKALDELRFRTGKPISPRFSFREDILAGIRKFYDNEDTVRELVIREAEPVIDDLPIADPEEEDTLTELEFIVAGSREENKETMKELHRGVKKRSLVVRFLSMILTRAVRKNASDLHIEPRAEAILVRMGVDGVLRELMTIPVAHQHAVTSRIKSLAGMDNNTEQRLPQDGRFLMTCKGRRFDVRVSTLPTYFGERILMRILTPETAIHTFERVGLGNQTEDTLKRLLSLPQGMLIVAGPTGSGKSTTLYATLNAVSSPVKNVITLEDPVEYILDGVTQVQVNPRLGLTAATCLGPILHQNANVVMIGEIRDAETAEIGLRACQAGHLILTTLQANDSVSAITRFRDLGISPYLISSVSGILGQRLLRKLCSCKTEAPATKDYVQSLEALGLKSPVSTMYRPGGCASCENTGYKERVGIFEILPIDGMMRHAIHAGSEEDDIRIMLQGVGFRNMQADALDKVAQGMTSLEEMMRVVPIDTVSDLRESTQCAHKVSSGFRYCPFCGMAVRPDQQTAVRN